MDTNQDCVLLDCSFSDQGQRLGPDDDTAAALRWQHIDARHPQALVWLHQAGIPPTVAEALVREETRPRSLSVDDALLLNLRGVNQNPGADPQDMVSIRLWINPTRVISCRLRRVQAVEDLLAAAQNGAGPRSAGHWLVLFVELIADRIGEFVNGLDDAMFELESGTAGLMDSQPISRLRREAAAVRRFLAPQREALDAALRAGRSLLTETEWFMLREQTDRFSRYFEDLDLLRERALVLQEEVLHRAAQQQNQRMYVLSLVAAVFLPLGFFTGLFGVNVGGMPGTDNQLAFALLCIAMTTLAAVVYAVMRWRRWL